MKSFPKTPPLNLPKKHFLVKFKGGELDGREQRYPITATRKTNPPFLNKSWHSKHKTRKTDKGFIKHNEFYVCKEVGPVQPDQEIIYVHKPRYRPK